MKPIKDLHLGEEALGGLSAGIIGTVIGYPLDMVKTRMQTTGGTSKGIIGTTSKIARKEGILALYKGMTPSLISLSILNTCNFTLYSFFRDRYQAGPGFDFRNGLAGMSGAPFGSLVSTVENLVKTQMQVDNIQEKRYTGSLHCARTIVKEHGLSVLYTGHAINTSREALFLGTYFYTYEGFRELILTHFHDHYKVAVPVAGGISGALSWFLSFPLDCVRAGVQGRNLKDSAAGAFSVFTFLIKEKGVRRLYAGVAPSIVRAFLVSGSRFSAYEGALWLLRGGRDIR